MYWQRGAVEWPPMFPDLTPLDMLSVRTSEVRVSLRSLTSEQLEDGFIKKFNNITLYRYRICDLVVKVSGYRSRGPGLDSRRYKIF
jgi:hypothetical protein